MGCGRGLAVTLEETAERADKVQRKLVAHKHNASPGQVEVPTKDFDEMYLLILELRQQLGI